ncbi:porin [Thiorhodospira sibirica]|uniref:porin n=1 Tax=Thiorhodospira sibirica TaxID=154347 RepID=UPI00022C288B|nr:porin [Thiorhodospira sibirica]
MKKSMLAVAVAAAIALPVSAMAETVVYGRIHTSLDFVDNGADSSHQAASRSSRIGFKGAEDLGGGLQGIWQLESGYHATESGGQLATRNTFVGLKGGFGTALIGRHDTPYKTSTGRLDPFGDTAADYNTIMGSVAGKGLLFDSRTNNTIAYMTPSFGGFGLQAAYVTDTRSGGDRPGETANDNKAFSLAANYGAGPVYVTAAYEQLNNFTGDNNARAAKIGGAYTLGDLTLSAMYERIDLNDDVIGSRDSGMLAARYNFNQINLRAAYLQANDDDRDDTGAKMFALGAGYNFSRRTEVYAVLAQMKQDTDAASLWALGTGGNKEVAPAPGEDTTRAISLGVAHNF